MVRKIAAKVKTKKKKWFELVAPKIFHNMTIGETRAYSLYEIIGRKIETNLMVLTRDMKKHHVVIEFIVKEAAENRGRCEVTGYRIINSYMKRIVRKGRTKIDDSFILKTKEGKLVRIKPFVLTRGNANKKVAHEIRMAAREFLSKYVSKQVFEAILQEIISNKVQKDLYIVLKKIHPIKTCEIRVFKTEEKKLDKKILKIKEKPKKTEESEEEKENAQTNSKQEKVQ